jgi:hypothetical protein
MRGNEAVTATVTYATGIKEVEKYTRMK